MKALNTSTLLSLCLLTACGGGGSSESDANTDDATGTANTLAIAEAGAALDVARNAAFSLDGGGSRDADGDALGYTWTQTSGPDVTGGAGFLKGPAPAITAPAEVSTLEFSLVVNDGKADSAADTVQVNVMENPAEAVFVDGDDGSDTTGDGSRAKPYASILHALSSLPAPGYDVYVKTGNGTRYREFGGTSFGSPDVISIVVPEGSSLYGGYGIGWVRDVDGNKTPLWTGSRGIRFASVDLDTWFSGFSLEADNGPTWNHSESFGISADTGTATLYIQDNVVNAGNVNTGTGSSTGLSLSGIDAVRILRNTISAGDGGNGAAGTDGLDGNFGGNGSSSSSRTGGSGGHYGFCAWGVLNTPSCRNIDRIGSSSASISGGGGGSGGGVAFGNGNDGGQGFRDGDRFTSPTGAAGGAGGVGFDPAGKDGDGGFGGFNLSQAGAGGNGRGTISGGSFVNNSATDGSRGGHGGGGGGGGGGEGNLTTTGAGGGGGGSCLAVDGTASTNTSETSSMTISHTTSGTNRLMLVGVSINNNQDEEVVSPSGITYNGVALTRVGFVNHQGSGGNDGRVEIWRLLAPATGTHDVVINFTADLNQPAVAGVMTFTGVDQTTPLGAFASNYGTSNAASVSVASAVDELVFAVLSGETVSTVTTEAPATEHWNIAAVGSLITEYGAGATEDGAATTIVDWTMGSSDYWAAAAVPIKGVFGCGTAAGTAVAEISPNDVTTNSTGNAFAYDIQASIGAGDTGVDRVGITVPANFTMGSVTGVLVNGASVSYTDNTSGNDISVDLATKLTSSARITVLFTADAPTSQNLGGDDFVSTVDDSATPDAPQATTEGNGDGDAGDLNDWTVTTTNGLSCSIALDGAASTGTSLASGHTGITISHTTSGTDRLMLVGVSINNDGLETVSSVTYNGANLNFEGAVNESDDARVEIWSLVAPDTGTHDVIITFSATLQRSAVAGVQTFTGVDQSTPLGLFASNNNTNAGPASVTVSSATDELVFAVMSGETVTSVTVDAPASQLWNLDEPNPGPTEFGAGATSAGATSVTVDFSLGGSDHWAAGGISIKPSSSCAGGPGVDHFAIIHDGTGINCQAENVTIEAHNSSHVVDTGFAGTLSLSTSTKHGDWSIISGFGSLTNGANGNAVYGFSGGDAGVVTLGLADTFVETINIDVDAMGMTEDPSEDDSIVFARSGFNFLADSAKNTIGLQIGGKPSNVAPGAQTLELQAVKTNDDSGACEAALVGANTIDIGFECQDPDVCASDALTFNGVTLPGNANGAVPTYARVSMDFGNAADSTATFTMTYDDVGKIKLHARNRILPSGEEMIGGSNSFVVRPFAFDLSVSGNPAADNPGGTVFTSAGSEFTADVTALLWQAGDDLDSDGIADNHDDTDPSNNADLSDNAAAPNYGYEYAVEQVLLTAALDQPAGGANPGLSGGTNVTVFTAGSGTTTTVRYDEVGIIEMAAQVADNDYLGIGAAETTKIRSKSGYVGRFNPARYAVTASDINPTCAATFTYARQAFTGSMTIEAQNADAAGNNRTQNFRAAFVTLDPATELTFINNQTGTAYDSKSVTYNQNFDSGNFGEAVLALLFRWDMPEQAPATSTVLNTAVTDEVTTLAGAPVTIGSTPVRHGRALIGTATGSELIDLGVVMRTEYFLNSTSGYVVNTEDFCSMGAAMSLSNFAGNLNAGETCVQDTGSPGLSGAGCTVAGPVLERFDDPLIAGDANLWLKAPGAGNDGSATVSADVPGWLEFDWDVGVPGLEDPSGHVVFGIYGGDKDQVYRRELFR